jgi:acetyl-CoA carboxylase carboxyl transferase subunit beta
MMEQLFKERKEKLYLFKSLRKKRQQKRKEVPEGLYSKCPDCKELILTSHLKKNLSVCPNCGSHLKLSAYERLEMLYDQGKYKDFIKQTLKSILLIFQAMMKKLIFFKRKPDSMKLLWSLVAKSMKQKLLLVSWIHVF